MNAIVSAELVYRLGWTLLHSLWIGAAVALALAAVLALMDRRSAVARYGAAMGAMMVLIAGIGVAFAIVKAPAPPAAQSAIESRAESTPPSSVVASVPVSDVDRHIQRQPWNGVERIKPEVEPAAQAAAGEGHWLRPALPWIAGGWAAGVMLLSLWQLGGWIAVQRLKVIGVEAVGRDVEMMGRRLAERLGLSAAIRVVQSMRVETPLLVGWIRPVVLMPAAVLSGLSPRQLEAILAHELAHIRRHDYLINLFQVVAETLLFYHPAVWWISRRIRLEREQCCDDVAVGVCGDRHCYVESLAALEELRLAGAVALGARGSGESQLMVRIRRLLRPAVHVKRSRTYGISVCASAIILTALIVLGGRGVSTRVFAAGERAKGEAVDVAALVRKAREGELWVDRVKSLRIRGELWAMPVADKAGKDGSDSAGRPTTNSASKWMDVEVAFDGHRIYQGDRIVSSQAPRKESRRVWDSKRMVVHEDYGTREQYVLDKQPSTSLNELFSYFGWPRFAPHRYWWERPEERTGEDFWGAPEDFRLAGRETVNGVECYVVETEFYYRTLYIGVGDGRLYGVKERVIPRGTYDKEQAVMLEVARDFGQQFTTPEQYSKWEQSLSAQQRHAVIGARFRKMKPLSVPYNTHWYSDYREVAPGCWAPMVQRWRFEPEADPSEPIACEWIEARLTEVAVNQPLPDELFKIEMKEGVQVWDYTHEPYLTYKYKKSFTPQEWQAILDEAANREWKNRLDEAETRERERLIKGGKEAPNKGLAQPSTRPATRPAADVGAVLKTVVPLVTKIDFSKGVGLRDALDFFRDVSGIRVQVDWDAVHAAGIDDSAQVTFVAQGVSVAQVLDMMLQDAGGGKLAYEIRGNILFVSTKQALPSTQPATRPAAEIIDIHLGAPRGPIKAERVIPYGSAIEFRWTVGNVSETPGQFLLQVVPTFQGPQPPAGDDRKGWVLKHIPGDVRSLVYGRRWDGADTGAKDLLPGTYSVMLVAHSKADDEARKPIAITPVSFTIAPAAATRPAGAVPATARPAVERPSTRAAYNSPIEAYEAQQKAKLGAAMGRTLQNVDLSNTTFKEALERFEKESGIGVTVAWSGLKAMGITPDRPINLKFPGDATAGQIIDAILSQAARAPGQVEYRIQTGKHILVAPPPPGIAELLKTPLPPTITVDFSTGVSPRDAFDFIRDVTGIRVQVDWDAIREAGIIDDSTTVAFKFQHVTAGQILDTILQQAGGGKLGYQIRGNTLFVSTKQALPSTQPATQVSMEMRFITVDREVWQKLGVEMKLDVPAAEKGGRGMKGALLDEKAMAKIIRSTQSERSSSLISAPRLIVSNGQVGSILIGGDGPDNEAISIKARPVVSEDRSSIKLALDAKLSGLAEAKEAGEKAERQVRELHVLPSIPDGQTLAMVMAPDLEVEVEKAGGGTEKRRQVLVAFVKPTAIIAREPEQEQKEFPLLGR